MARVTEKPQEAQALPADATAESGPSWQTLTVEVALQQQGIDASTGLSSSEAAARLKQYGPNTFAQAKQEPGWRKFLRQYQDTMQIVILVAALVSGFAINQWGTALILFAVTLFNAFLGLHQEGKAEASMAALQKMMEVKTRVRRDGQLMEIPADQVVPGDIVVLEAGDRVPADGRIIKAATLEIAEAALTGESLPVSKEITPVAAADTPLGDRTDMAYMNTEVTRGAGELLVTSTGMKTEVGHISDMLQTEKEEKTPLTKQLDALTNQLIVIAAVALLFSILIGRSRGVPRDLLFLTAIAFSISAIPTGLPAVVTYLLSQGATALASAGAIMKRLRSVETLGATSAINSDKTGTLTLNQMTAVEMVMPAGRFTIQGEGYSTVGQITQVAPPEGGPELDLKPYLLPMALCADAVVKDGALVGDPTEGALIVLAAKGGIDPVPTREEIPRVAELPFDAAYKMMATFHRVKDEAGRDVIRAFVKGAPDQVLARSKQTLDSDGKTVPIAEYRDQFVANNERLGARGLRVMAVARKDFDPTAVDPSGDLLSQITDLTILALVGIVDPPRAEAKAAIAKAKTAGIQVRMITGDHAVTAGAIASDLGIEGRAITGAEFSALSDAEAAKEIDDIGVIARVAPEDKVRLVDVLKKKDNIVAMTGDGVNDAPALKAADIGVAMGITGTDVSKEAAVMILTDDNFATIVKAVEGGRALYDNLMKYIRLQMGLLFGFIAIFLGAAIFNILDGAPFLPQQTLWVNFTVTVFLAIGLGLGAATPGIMERPPRPANAKILPRTLMIITILFGLSVATSGLAAAEWALNAGWGDPVARTIALTTFSIATIFLALECNDQLTSVFTGDPFENSVLVKMVGWAALATFVVTELDFLNRLFATTPLNIKQWVVCLVASSLVLWVAEGIKFYQRRQVSQAGAEPAPQREVQASASPS
jgi:Ca2+-transporting ATPase